MNATAMSVDVLQESQARQLGWNFLRGHASNVLVTSPYRNDLEALVAELEQAQAELRSAEANKQRFFDAAERERQLRHQVDELRKRVRLGSRRNLPFLNDVRVATPCHADWDSMQGDERARFCGICQKDVFDLSGMDARAAEAFVRERSHAQTETCIRFFRRADGTVMTNDCPTGVSAKRRRHVVAGAIGASVLSAAGLAVGLGMRPHMGDMARVSTMDLQKDQPYLGQMVMGEMVAPQPRERPEPSCKTEARKSQDPECRSPKSVESRNPKTSR